MVTFLLDAFVYVGSPVSEAAKKARFYVSKVKLVHEAVCC